MHIKSGDLLHRGKTFDHLHLGLRVDSVDEKVNDGDSEVDHGLEQACFILEVESERLSTVLLDCFRLLLRPNETIKILVCWKIGFVPAGKDCAAEVAGAACDQDVVRHDANGFVWVFN